MPKWVRPETFLQLEAPQEVYVYVSDLDPEWIVVPLPEGNHPELYEYFTTGGELLHRINRNGELELFALIDNLDPKLVAQARWGYKFAQASDNRLVFQLIMKDKEDEPPYELPFTYNLTEVRHRYEAAALCEQPGINLYFLSRQKGRLCVLFSREFEWPDDPRQSMRQTIVKAYVPAKPHFDQKSGRTMDAMELADDDLLAEGWSYQFDHAQLEREWGADALIRMESLMTSHLQRLSSHGNSGLKKGPFILWVALKPILGTTLVETLSLIYFVTPFYSERMKGRKSDNDPLYSTVSTMHGFIRSEGSNPIWEGAVPSLQYLDGAVTPIRFSDEFLERAAHLNDNINRMQALWSGHPNIDTITQPNYYRMLLKQRKQK